MRSFKNLYILKTIVVIPSLSSLLLSLKFYYQVKISITKSTKRST